MKRKSKLFTEIQSVEHNAEHKVVNKKKIKQNKEKFLESKNLQAFYEQVHAAVEKKN